jgi:hypothetical protein
MHYLPNYLLLKNYLYLPKYLLLFLLDIFNK